MAMTQIERYKPPLSSKHLTPRQLAACEALARGVSQRAVCRDQKISRSTLYEWLQKPEFRAQVAEFQAIVLEEVRTQLISMLPDAASALKDTITQRPTGPPSHAERTRAVELALKVGILASSANPATAASDGVVQVVIGSDVAALAEMEGAQAGFMARAHKTHLGNPEFQRLYDAWQDTGLSARVALPVGDPERQVMLELHERAYEEARRRFGEAS